jgi:HlyD family secretion protein
MSSISAPRISPKTPVPSRPGSAPAPAKGPGSKGLWMALLFALVMVWAALLWQKRSPQASVGTRIGAIRTATVSRGPVANTLRLTGVTAAENFASLVTPQLRGSRSDKNRDLSGSTAASASGTSSSAASTTSGTTKAPPAFQNATNRFSTGGLRGSVGQRPSAAVAKPDSPALGASGLGNAADQLIAGAAYLAAGYQGNDFSLVLRHAVKPGTHVEKGQVVAEFDRQYMLNRVDDYRAVVVQTEADLKKQKAELEIVRKSHDQSIQAAKGAFDKARLELQKIPVLSAMDAERTKLAFEEADARYQQLLKEQKFLKISQDASLRNSELDLAEAKLELRRAEANSSLMEAKAPLDGIAVMQSIFRNGELAQIQEGDQLWSGIFYLQVVDPRAMVVNAAVNQVDVEKLRVGQRATVRLDAYPGLELPAHVISIAAVTKPPGARASFVKEVPVRLKIDKTDPRVIPDLSISADVALANDDQPAAVVPAGAVFRDGALAGPPGDARTWVAGRTWVYVQSDSGWERRDVQLGLTNYLQASIRSGVKPGEVVALDRPRSLDTQ